MDQQPEQPQRKPKYSSGRSSEPAVVDGDHLPLEDVGFAERYAIERLLGEGGMGKVQLVRDARIGRRVALKIMHAKRRDDASSRVRFLREARVQGQLEHPAIAPVYDLGRAPGGSEYFTMKRVRGLTLAQVLDALASDDEEMKQRFSRRRLLTAFSNVVLAVHYAHERGVLHRDLKPSNLMLGNFGEVYLLDWGLAKIRGAAELAKDAVVDVASDDDDGTETHNGALLGTPGYIAPEVLRNHEADERADVYALGAILFYILTLEKLHHESGRNARIASTLLEEVPAPSERSPNGDIPPELDSLCLQATARDPAGRIQSARVLHDKLERYLDGDRDLALRRRLAKDHAATAEIAAETALSSGDDELENRKRALQEVGRALALDSNNRQAMSSMLRLLLEPPHRMPEQAARELEEADDRAHRRSMRLASWAYSVTLTMVPVLVWMGIRDWTWAAPLIALQLVPIATTWWGSRTARPGPAVIMAHLVTSTLSWGAITVVFGPYLVAPALFAVNAMAFGLVPRRVSRTVTTLICCLPIVVPALLQMAGVFPQAYAFEADAMTVLPFLVSFPALPTQLFLLLVSVVVIVAASTYASYFQEGMTNAQRRLHVQAWQLRQLLPEDDADVSAHGDQAVSRS